MDEIPYHPPFWGVAIIIGLLAIAFVLYGLKEHSAFISKVVNLQYDGELRQFIIGFVMIMIGSFLAVLCAFTAATAKEIDKEKDRGYVAAMFSNIVALVALVISLIALVKE